MAKRRLPYRMTKITLTVPQEVVDKLDALADDFEDYVSRSELVSTILEEVLEDEDYMAELFPEEED
jgi:metal-responsive CopG/Arc/MetJ family transcriptional regulator